VGYPARVDYQFKYLNPREHPHEYSWTFLHLSRLISADSSLLTVGRCPGSPRPSGSTCAVSPALRYSALQQSTVSSRAPVSHSCDARLAPGAKKFPRGASAQETMFPGRDTPPLGPPHFSVGNHTERLTDHREDHVCGMCSTLPTLRVTSRTGGLWREERDARA
jgi:hypothetical protein